MKILLSLLIFVFLAFPAKPQAHNSQLPPTFRLLSANGSYSNLYYDAKVHNKPQAIPLSFNQAFTSPLPWPVDGRFIAYRLIPPPQDAPPETPPGRVTVLAVDISNMGNHPVIVVFPNGSGAQIPLKGFVIKELPNKHTHETIKVVNLSSFPAAVVVGEGIERVAVGETQVFPFHKGRNLVQVAVNKGGGWKNVFRGERRLSSNLRGFIFITNYMEDPDYGPVDPIPPGLAKMFFEVSPDTLPSPKE